MVAPMKYTTLGSTGLVVSRMAFGAMTFTQGNKNIATLDEATTLPPVYPTWFIERLVDGELEKALA
jgi:hypothetical protein